MIRCVGALCILIRLAWPYGAIEAQVPPTPAVIEDPNGEGTAPQKPTGPDDSGPRLTLTSLQNLALTQNPTLEQARAGTWVAQGREVQAGLYPNPQIAYSGVEMGQDGKAGQQGLFVQQEFVTANKLGLSQNVYRWQQQATQQSLAIQRQRVMNSVRRDFYRVLVANRLIEVAQELVRIAEQGEKVIAARLAQGESSRIDQLQARIEIDRSQVILVTAQRRRDAAWRQLETTVGTRLEPAILDGNIEVGIPNLEWESTLASTLRSHPRVQRAQYTAAVARAALERASVEPVPNITVQAGSQYDAATNYAIGNLQVSIPVPLFDRNQGKITETQAQWIRASREIERVELELKRDLATAFQTYSARRAAAIRYHDSILPAARTTLELSQQAFGIGEIGYLQLLTAQKTFTQASRDYILALAQLWDAAISVESKLMIDGLSTPPIP